MRAHNGSAAANKVRSWRVTATTAIVGCAVALLGADQNPSFRTHANTVAVYATVIAPDGQLVTGLNQQDFQIFDNDKPQPIVVFDRSPQPITVVVMIDRSRSVIRDFRLVQLAADQFVMRLLPTDKARIGSFAYRIQVEPREFTSDKSQLLLLMRNLQEAGPTPLWNAINVGMTALHREDGRRVVLVFTDGDDAPDNGNAATNASAKTLLERARAEDIMVYAIGLDRPRVTMTALAGVGLNGNVTAVGTSTASNDALLGHGVPQKHDDGLLKLSAESGGGFFQLRSAEDLTTTFNRVADELHGQYALGFVPERLDGKSHAITVRVARAGVTVRARRSYVATSH